MVNNNKEMDRHGTKSNQSAGGNVIKEGSTLGNGEIIMKN